MYQWKSSAPEQEGTYLLRRGHSYWLVVVYQQGTQLYLREWCDGARGPLSDFTSGAPQWLGPVDKYGGM